jgi:hypothetical protein
MEEKGGLLHNLGHAMGKGRVNPLPTSSYLWGTDRGINLNRQKLFNRQKVCIVKQCNHRCVPMVQWGLGDHYLSPCSSRVPQMLFSLSSLKRSNLHGLVEST